METDGFEQNQHSGDQLIFLPSDANFWTLSVFTRPAKVFRTPLAYLSFRAPIHLAAGIQRFLLLGVDVAENVLSDM